MGSESSPSEPGDQTSTEPAAPADTEPASGQASGTTAQPDVPTLLIDMVAAVVMKQVQPLLEDLQKVKETGIPLPVEPEKPQVLELPKVNMDLEPGQIIMPGNSGAAEAEIPRVLIDTVVAVVLKEFAPLLQDLQKIRDQGMAGLGLSPTGPTGQHVPGDFLGRGAARGVMDEKTMMASIKAREDQMKLRVLKFQERYEALKQAAKTKEAK